MNFHYFNIHYVIVIPNMMYISTNYEADVNINRK